MSLGDGYLVDAEGCLQGIEIERLREDQWDCYRDGFMLSLVNNTIHTIHTNCFAAALTAGHKRTFEEEEEHKVYIRFVKLEKVVKGNFRGAPIRQLNIGDSVLTNSIEDGAFEGIPRMNRLGILECKLRSISAGMFRGAEQLQILDLSYNQFENLDLDAFSALPNLASLTIDKSKVRFSNSMQFPKLLQMRWLTLQENQIDFIPDNMFANLSNLLMLDLNSNLISRVSSQSFSGLKNLERLNLESNQLKQFSVDVIQHLSSLEELKLGKNSLDHFLPNENAILEKLDSIELKENKFKEIPKDALKSFPNIKKIDLSFNFFTNIKAHTFAKQSCLQKLLLNDNQISGLEESCFSSLKNLTELNLNQNQLSEAAFLPHTFSELAELHALALNSNKIQACSGSMFEGLSNLQRLELSQNLIGKLDAQCFEGLASLQFLDISQNRIEILRSSFSFGLGSLTDLNLESNKISHIDSEAFSSLKCVTRINLHQNSISQLYLANGSGRGEKSIFHDLFLLQELDLSQNIIEDHKWFLVFESLEKLESINLKNNRMASIESMFPIMKSLNSLNVSFNAITCIVSSAFCLLDSLSEIFLSDNKLEALPSDLFIYNNRLATVEFHNNSLKNLPGVLFPPIKGLELDLSNNQIGYLSPQIGPESFDRLDLSGNALLSIPVELIVNTLNVDRNSDIILVTSQYERIEGYEPEEDSIQLRNAISELYSRWKKCYLDLEASLRSYRKCLLQIARKFSTFDKKLNDQLTALLDTLDVEFSLKICLPWLISCMKKLGILFGLKIDEGRKLQDLFLSFAKKLRILSLQEDQCRKISKMLIRKADFNVLGQLDDSTLQWFVFVNSLYYEFDWSSPTENSKQKYTIFHSAHPAIREDMHSKVFQYNCDICRNPVTTFTMRCLECNFDVCSSCLQSSSVEIPKLIVNDDFVNFFTMSFDDSMRLIHRSGQNDSSDILNYIENVSYFFPIERLKTDVFAMSALSSETLTRIALFCLKKTYFPVNEALMLYVFSKEIGEKTANADLEVSGMQLLDLSTKVLEALPNSELRAMMLLQKPEGSYRNILDLISSFEIKKICNSSRISLCLNLMFDSKMLRPHSSENSLVSTVFAFFPSWKYLAAFNISNFSHHHFFAPTMEVSVRLWSTLICLVLLFVLALNPDENIFGWIVLGLVGGSSVLEEFHEFIGEPKEHFRSFWNIIDFGISMSCIAAASFKFWFLADDSFELVYFLYKFSVVLSGIFVSFRLLSFFRLSNSMGPLVIIFIKMFNDLFRYLFLSLVILVGYAIGMTALLSDYSNDIDPGIYDTVGNSFMTLVYSLLGNYSTDMFAKIESHSIYIIVNIFFITFLIMHVIMLINFLIAMMSTTFTTIYEDSQTEFKFLKAQIIRESYASRLRLPPPFAIISELVEYIILICTIFMKCLSKKHAHKVGSGWYCKNCLEYNVRSSDDSEIFSVRKAAVKIIESSELNTNPHLAYQLSLLFNDREICCRNCYNPYKKGKFRDRIQSFFSRALWGILISPIVILSLIFMICSSAVSYLFNTCNDQSKRKGSDLVSKAPTIAVDFKKDEILEVISDRSEQKEMEEIKLKHEAEILEKRNDSSYEELHLLSSSFGKVIDEILSDWESCKPQYNNERLLSMFLQDFLKELLSDDDRDNDLRAEIKNLIETLKSQKV